MAPDQIPSYISIIGIQGRNGSDSSFIIPKEQCLEAMNVDWYRSSLGRKRGGATTLAIAGGTAFSSGVRSMARHIPAADQTAAEFWAADGANVMHRLAGGTVWADPTMMDAISGSPQEINYRSFNGKLYIAYDSVHNRMHVWDPTDNKVRRAGLDLPAAPTSALAGGAVNDTRRYRVAWTKQVAGVTILRSNLGTATGSVVLAAQQDTLTRPTAPGETETHWELWAASTSSSFGDYRLVGTALIATTTIVDNAALSTTVSPADGANTPPPSARYIVADDARIIMGGAWETLAENSMAPKNNRVWWTSILGASDVGDDERVSFTGTINNYADVEEAITGISEPLQLVSATSSSLDRGSFYVFSFQNQWKFVATGVSAAPYLRFRISGGGGCIHHKSIVSAEDANGNPSTYWAATKGIMRISATGQEYMSEDCVDLWSTINLDATIPCHGVFHADIHQIWFYIATGTSLYPDTKLVFDTRLGKVVNIYVAPQQAGVRLGWSQHTGESAKAYCSCLFSDSVAASMGRKLKPYIGYTGSTALWKCDTSDLTDAGTPFQAYIDTKSYVPWGLDRVGGMPSEAHVLATTQPGVTIDLTIYRDEGAESMHSTANLTDFSDSAAALKVMAKFDDSRMADSMSFRCRIGDIQAIANTWNLDALIVPVSVGQTR